MAIDLKKYLPGGDVIKPDDLKGQIVTTTIQQLSERKWDDGGMSSLRAHPGEGRRAPREGQRPVVRGATGDATAPWSSSGWGSASRSRRRARASGGTSR